jgi:MFS family permease
VFALTGDTFAVAMIAVAGLLPMIVAGLYGGMLADAFDRRTVALIAATVTFASTALLAALAWTGAETVWWLYVLSIVNSAANSIVLATAPRSSRGSSPVNSSPPPPRCRA